MLGRTADDGVMGLAGVSKVLQVKALHDEIVAWSRRNPVAVHMPVDSPSANFPLSARLKPMGARIVNLVAPQLWAWAPWRIRKVRRISDILLCLLPFEEDWFRSRGVVAKYVGHPVLSHALDEMRIEREAAALPTGAPRIVLLPGSRSSEVRANGRLLADAFAGVRTRLPGALAVVVASNEANARNFLLAIGGELPAGISMFVAGQGGTIEGAIRWSDLALAVSGTVSLDCTRQGKPMIGVYRTSRLEALGAKLVIRARHLLLPNIIAGRRIVPEFVPFAGRAGQITDCALAMLENPERLARTSADLRVVAASFLGRDPARIASEVAFRSALGERLGNAELDAIVESGTSSPDVS